MVEQKGALEAQMATLEARAKDSGACLSFLVVFLAMSCPLFHHLYCACLLRLVPLHRNTGKNKQALRAQAKSLKTSLTAVRKSAKYGLRETFSPGFCVLYSCARGARSDAKSVVQSAVRDFNALFTEASRSIPKR